MSKILIIVESPAKAKTINRFLGKDYIVKSSMGHVRDLPKSQLGVDVENNFEPKYITIRGKGKIVKELRSAAQKSSQILLAPDPDREGEAIAWHLKQVLGLKPEKYARIEFHEITKSAIRNAVANSREIDFDRVNAQQARRILDRLVGYNLSPLLWRKIRKGLSAGRVQSVAVRLICERDQEIESFEPQEYWSIEASFLTKPILVAQLIEKDKQKLEIKNHQKVTEILEELEGVSFHLQSIKKQERKRKPPLPFITSTLQQEAFRKLNFSSRKTMRIAQQLYEGVELGKDSEAEGLITYIRTDSTRLAKEFQLETRKFIEAEFGKQYLPDQIPIKSGSKQIQDAHEAIRPTLITRKPDAVKGYLTRDQYRLYRLIWERTVASQMRHAVLEITTINIKAGSYMFRASGTSIKFSGFQDVYIQGVDDTGGNEKEKKFPPLSKDVVLKLKELSPKQHFTKPPPRYTEASLIKTMENLGIGRPSTYAPTIETILQRNYVEIQDKRFQGTELGGIVVDLLKKYFPKIIEVKFTAEMEGRLDSIEKGELDWKEVIRNFYEPFQKVLKTAEEEIGSIKLEEEVTDEKCEKCGRNMVIKTGRYGKFMACPGFPECRNTKPILESIGVNCPRCGSNIVIRRSKRGKVFYGCSSYPACNFLSWDKPTEKKCPECGTQLVEKQKRNQGAYFALSLIHI